MQESSFTIAFHAHLPRRKWQHWLEQLHDDGATVIEKDERTFRLEGPAVPGGAEAPNRRLAERLCPGGYRVIDSLRFKRDPGEGTYTNWTIRCL